MRLAQHVPEAVRVRRRVVLPEAGEGPEDAKKRAARARQEAIMRQMREQQASFVNNINDDDYEDEDSTDADEPASLGTCIVCQEELNASKPFGALGLVQPSKLVRKQPDGNGGLMNDVMTSPYSLDRSPPASASPRSHHEEKRFMIPKSRRSRCSRRKTPVSVYTRRFAVI
jgi:E3 ubiquitin-protein ligase UBR1